MKATVPPVAALVAETPKTSVGIISGSDEHREDQAAAPDRGRQRRPDGADEGERRRADEKRRGGGQHRLRRQGDEQAEQRRRQRQRQPGRQPMGERLGQHHELERQRRGEQQVEGAVLLVGLEQAVETDQGRQHRGQPQDRRADTGEQVQVGPERERHERDQHQEEDQPERPRAADPRRQLHVARDDRREGARQNPSPLTGEVESPRNG